MQKKSLTKLLTLALLGMPLLANAVPTSTLSFTKGSYCTSFSGNLNQGRNFKINLNKGQQLVITSNDAPIKSVIDSKGKNLKDVGDDNYTYNTVHKGLHTIQVGSGYGDINVCAY